MANYLGKISALVTANTRDFDQKLNASAKEVGRFAGSISRDLSSASSRAAKSLSEIYTQAQKVERALQAATSGRLDFKGVREFIDNLRSADNSVQSLEKSVRRLSSGQQAELLSRSSFASIDEFIAKFRQAGQLKNALDDQKVRVALEFIGVEEARRKLQQLASVDFEISGPLQRAVVEVQKFPAAIQRSLNPALTEAQLLVQGLENEIRDGAVISEQAFDRAAKSVEKFNAVVARASEARRLVGGLQTGNEIAFANPNFVQAQKESAEAQRRAAALSATQLKGNPQVRELVSQIAEVSQEAERLRAEYDQLSTAGSASAASVGAALDGQISKQRELNSLLEREVTLIEAGSLTSAAEQINKPLENAASSFNRLSLEVQANFAPALERAQKQAELLFKLIESGRSPSEKSFAAVQSRVEQTTQAISRLAQAQQLASRSLTGTELQFKNPALFEVLSQSAATTQRAGELPSSRLQDGAIAGQVEALQQYQQAAVRAQAQLENLTLDPRVDPSVIESQTGRLNNLIETARRAQQALAAATSTPQDDTEALIERERRAKQIEEQISSAEDRRRVEKAKADNEEIERLIEKERRAKKVEEEISSAEQERANKKKRADEEEIQALIRREQAAKRLAAAADQQQAKEAQIVNRRKQIAEEFASRSSAAGLALDLDSSELSSAQAKLNVLRQTLSKLSSSEAAGAEAAISRLGSAISSAMANGTIRTAETRREIERLTQEAVEASAAAANINPRSLSRSVDRAGDVGRRGFDNVSLALNQAAFAVDDFLSSTGGLEFKIRAVQNNLTQLGFILGGTTGLFVTLGIVIAGQATIALINFLNEGRKTEDMVKALNDSLSRQKEVAGEVGSAFEEIGRELGSDVFSDAANDAQRLTERLEQLTDAFKRLREERIAQSTVTGQEAQANINSLDRRLQAEEDPGVRILLQRQLLEARRRAAEVTAGLSEPITVLGGIARFREAITPLEESRGSGTQQRLTREQIGENIDSVISNADIRDFAGLRAAVEARLEETAALVNTGEGAFRVFRGAFSDVAADEVGNLQSLLTSLQNFQQAGEALSNAANVSDSIRKSLAEARDRIDEFGEGIESAGRFSDAIDAQGRILEQAVSSISAAFERLERFEISPEQFLDALNSAAASVDAETVARAQLIRDIEATFNEEERLRLDGAKAAQEAAAKRAEEDLKASTERGRQLLLGESGRLAEQISASINDIRNAGGGQRDVAAFLADQARQAAPAFFALQDASANAVLQGPSRAALQASDISTQQGTAELNRLLRGDDPARDQNLVELRKQSSALQTLVALAQRDNPGVAN